MKHGMSPWRFMDYMRSKEYRGGGDKLLPVFKFKSDSRFIYLP